MNNPFAARRPAVLKTPDNTAPRRASGVPVSPTRSFQVLQSSRAPAQLCLFLRPGAIDVK
ncbi:MAG: hypothetical protein E6H79_21275 [Betaproteobacteria bacterium]|jgi:hypothetical protein|nr:MAG: hypothetical protein E6H79_21275 [Betaproteobacteria bacterium]